MNVNIRDINDNRPTFKEDILDVYMSEMTNVGYVASINQAKAGDTDLGW